MLGCITEREDPADALVVNSKNADYTLETLPEGSVVGTSNTAIWLPLLSSKLCSLASKAACKYIDDGKI